MHDTAESHISLLETREIFRLMHELCEMGHDAYAWRTRMLEELRRMTDADKMSGYLMKRSIDLSDITGPKLLVRINVNLDELWEEYVDVGDLSGDPVTPFVMQHFGTDFTVARQEILDDETWYASSFFANVASKSNWDQAIYSQVAITPPGVVDGIGIARALGKPAFGPREVAIVRFLHQELARLWRRPDPIGIHTLPTRQREVLDGIRRGESRKVIAEKMGASDHTVHTYEKALFERAEVKSRGELLARVAQLIRPNLLP